MDKTEKSNKELLDDILSGDSYKIWYSSATIMKLSQDEERIKEFVPYLDEIIEKTKNVDLGGSIALNSRFVEKVIKVLEYYKDEKGCSCCLLGEEDDPNNYETIDVMETVCHKNSTWIDYYIVECTKCKQKYKVGEREYHYTWWDWKKC